MAEVHVGKGGGRAKRPRPVIIPPQKAGMRILLSIIGSVLTALIGFFIMLPPLNFRAPEFYFYLILVFGSFAVLLFLLSNTSKKPEYGPWVRKTAMPAIAAAVVIALFFGVAWVFSSPLFLARRYAAIMPIAEDISFAQGIDEVDFSLVPKIDEDAARIIANTELGALAEVVSQFTLSNTSTQIVYNGRPVRIFPLAYADIVRWAINTSGGLPGFVMVYMDDETSEFHFLEENMRFTDEEHLFRLLNRHVRFSFPTYLLGTPSFVIDNDRNPYWVVPRMNRLIGLVGGEDVIGAILVNAVTGEFAYYDIADVPEWVDRVYTATLLNTQFDWFGRFSNGFINSFLGQRDVFQGTPGYNYLIQRNDVYMYSGVSSVVGDDAIIGFILVNQRTREAHFYATRGATENRAQRIAEGLVQAEGWRATHPLLINVSGHATYFMALKDASSNVQGFALVNVDQFNIVNVWAPTLEESRSRYIASLRDAQDRGLLTAPGDELPGDDLPAPPDITDNISAGPITSIRTAVVNNNTNLLISVGGAYYRVVVTQDTLHAVLLNVGDYVEITSDPGAALLPGNVVPAVSIRLQGDEPPTEDYPEEPDYPDNNDNDE